MGHGIDKEGKKEGGKDGVDVMQVREKNFRGRQGAELGKSTEMWCGLLKVGKYGVDAPVFGDVRQNGGDIDRLVDGRIFSIE